MRPISRNQVAQRTGGAVLSRERELFSIVPIINSGASPDGNAKFQFFRDNFAIGVTNIKQPGKLTQTGTFRLMGMGFDVFLYNATNASESGPSATIPNLTAECKRQYYEGGQILGKLNSYEIIESYGLNQWPAGGGLDGFAGAATTASTTSINSIHVNNGTPHTMNRRFLRQAFEINPEDIFELTVDFVSLIALPSSATGKIICRLWGEEILNPVRG